LFNDIFIIIILSIIRILFIYVRGTYPRIRYDKLIRLTWKQFLPITLWYLIIVLIITYWCCAGMNG
jgi:NADH-quinone oxidoreductase subunit H